MCITTIFLILVIVLIYLTADKKNSWHYKSSSDFYFPNEQASVYLKYKENHKTSIRKACYIGIGWSLMIDPKTIISNDNVIAWKYVKY